ncbi:DNA topoisomerase III [Paenibacillus thiaminolyticus]|uniref:DNA topoisomerase n=1 Tax=Paenibacillus thiaminolyticus TaxID=49283 RepID=A0AAP9DV14_PANTH|nr:DNA topoisomerase III [Paenibacillus thiaminolyticus]MCY9535628.1 DNA topoisomerase III [Paenibacillus thiaminolyticus]MCY9600332.1 DNA topoisomerase III [Paenibacillus thiaminolyticus]MCY9607338.1 DNA topoisomerase III [Paenibacillus thiaminolyticus]MCY9613919.1 DNA topoisomerase III [Paenibacillus thiaminolyticus]MCY9617924.1 DNA topoisomerase III [Paenibacillus thiaminolyticus]
MKSLVLAEKPSVARELARVLGCRNSHKTYFEGPDYVVTWALGHLVGLAEPEDYDKNYQTWRLEDLPIIPDRMRLKVLRESSHQFKAVQQLCKRQDLKDLIVATDAAREGELLARWIMQMVKWNKPFHRLWISSQTDKAIREGFRQLKPGKAFDRLYESARCRAEADWLIGLNVTRALTTKFETPLSAGRVQTPTLAMLMKREQEIREFQSQEYETVHADFGGFEAAWRAPGGDARLFRLEEAAALTEKLRGREALISGLKKSEKSEPHPLAYDLTELQRDANRRYGFSAKQTSNVLQRLYEQHKLVTYPRTDSRYLSSDMTGTLPERLDAMAVGPYAAIAKPLLRGKLHVTKRIVDDAKVTDHHAIIPTDEPLRLANLSPEERKLYDLIARRFLALFLPPVRYEQVAVTIGMGGEQLHAKGKTVIDNGWKKAYENDWELADDDDDADEAGRAEQRLPSLTQGQRLQAKRVLTRRGRTKPPARYTEATLLTQMEKYGLGTPATRADIIEKLVSSDTIERQGSSLQPTGKGTQLINLVSEQLRSPELTAQWERELEQIARGSAQTSAFMTDIRKMTEQLVSEVKRSQAEYKPHNLTSSHCPECGSRLMERKGKRGKWLVCSNKSCEYRRSEEKNLSNRRCPQCHKKMEFKIGKAGKFVQCLPCNITEKLEEGGGRIKKHEERKLVKQFEKQEPLGNNLGDLLKAALAKQNGE